MTTEGWVHWSAIAWQGFACVTRRIFYKEQFLLSQAGVEHLARASRIARQNNYATFQKFRRGFCRWRMSRSSGFQCGGFQCGGFQCEASQIRAPAVQSSAIMSSLYEPQDMQQGPTHRSSSSDEKHHHSSRRHSSHKRHSSQNRRSEELLYKPEDMQQGPPHRSSSSDEKHHHSSRRHSSHKHSSQNRRSDECNEKHRTKSSTQNPEYTPDTRPRSEHHRSRQESGASSRQARQQGDYPQQMVRNTERHNNSGFSQSVPQNRTSAVPPPPSTPNVSASSGTPVPHVEARFEEISGDGRSMEVSYPGAYYEEGSSAGSSSSGSGSEEVGSLSDMENGEGLITAYAVPNDESYFARPEDAMPRELVTRSAPPPPSRQTVEASRQSNETKQSLNITVPQGTSPYTHGSSAVVSSVNSPRGGNTCLIYGAVGCAIFGTLCVISSFLFPIFTTSDWDTEEGPTDEEVGTFLFLWWILLIAGIVLLIVSCSLCCCLCCRSNTNVTTVVSNPQ
jgi:hypothetical protein